MAQNRKQKMMKNGTKLEAKLVLNPNENLAPKYDADNDAKFGIKKDPKFCTKKDAFKIVQ